MRILTNWTDKIKLGLESKNKLGFIGRTIPQPDQNDSKFKRWKKINTLIRSWIFTHHRILLESFNYKDKGCKNDLK